MLPLMSFISFFFFNDTATTEIYTLSLHDALPISIILARARFTRPAYDDGDRFGFCRRSEEHTSELQSRRDLVCRLLLEKKKKTKIKITIEFHNVFMKTWYLLSTLPSLSAKYTYQD